MNFDLAQLEIGDTAIYQVVDARGNEVKIDGRPFTITVYSPGTRAAVNAQFKRDEARSARVIGMAGGAKSKRTVDEELRERADFLEAITAGTSHPDVTYKGKRGMNALREMYLEPKLGHVADGIEKVHNDRGNFSVAPPISSSDSPDTSLG